MTQKDNFRIQITNTIFKESFVIEQAFDKQGSQILKSKVYGISSLVPIQRGMIARNLKIILYKKKPQR